MTNFGNPFLLQIGDDEALAHIKQRIQVLAAAITYTPPQIAARAAEQRRRALGLHASTLSATPHAAPCAFLQGAKMTFGCAGKGRIPALTDWRTDSDKLHRRPSWA